MVRQIRLLWIFTALLLLSVVGLARMEPPERSDAEVGRIAALEAKLDALAVERTAVTERFTKTEKMLAANLRFSRNESKELVDGVWYEINQNQELLESRLKAIESALREAHDEIARIREELTGNCRGGQ